MTQQVTEMNKRQGLQWEEVLHLPKDRFRNGFTSVENWKTFGVGIILFALFLAFLLAVQFSTPHLVGNDGYYHIKLAYIMRTEGLKPAFPWLPLTILNADSFVDHHFLFHVLLIPFTYGDLITGGKLASAIFPAFTFWRFGGCCAASVSRWLQYGRLGCWRFLRRSSIV